jgi:DNA-binding MarR family transcriptional regulator
MSYEPGPKRRIVLELSREGKSVREIADLLKMSTQNVYRHLDALRERGLLDREVAS